MGKQLAVTVNAVHRVGSKMYLTTGGVHRKVKKAYLTNGGVHKLCYDEGGSVAETMTISYTGTMTDAGLWSMADGDYRLIYLMSSGTLTVDTEVAAEVWMCGGGGNGAYSSDVYGGAGAYTATGSVILSGSMTATVAGAGGASSFGTIKTKSVAGKSGGTGGGDGMNLAGTGDGVAKYPFSDTTVFTAPFCAAGGGGARISLYKYKDEDNNDAYDIDAYNGGAGGTNGGNGSRGYYSSDTSNTPRVSKSGGAGGNRGGGAGGSASISSAGVYTNNNGANATFWGSGGGGGSLIKSEHTGGSSNGSGGSGYQGVIYIRIPVNQ